MNQPIFYVSLALPPSTKKAEEDSVSSTSLTTKRTKSRSDKLDKGGKEAKGYVHTYVGIRYNIQQAISNETTTCLTVSTVP